MGYENLRVAVTGLNATDNPGPGVPVVRAIRADNEFNGQIIGLTYDPLDPGVFMENICNDVYMIPYPSEGSYVMMERIREIQAKTPIDVLIPNLDSELPLFISMEKELKKMGIKTFLPHKNSLDLRNKSQFDRLSQDLGIRVPEGMVITSPSSIYEVEKKFDFPVMIKGQFYEAYIAHSPGEAEHLFRKISAKWGLPVIVQEFISGEEYDVVALGDGEGTMIGAVPMRKMQMTDKGKAWGGVTIHDPDMAEFARDIIKKIKWRGPCELEIMKRSKDGEYFLIEINPRFPAWSYLSVGAGQNLPLAAMKLALEEKVAPFESYNVGTMFIRNSVDHIYSLSDYQQITTVGEIHR